jgi:DNA invertase Pin-like site-specific DNA recombinase
VLIGCVRVWTGDQDLSLQLDALTDAGCARCFSDTASRSRRERPQLRRVLEELRDREDTLVVWRLDRLGRSLRHLIEFVSEIEQRRARVSLTHRGHRHHDVRGTAGVSHLGAIAEFERQLIRERTQAGLRAARARGRLGGRRTVIAEHKVRVAQDMIAGGGHTVQQIAETIGVGRATLNRHLATTERPAEASSPGRGPRLPLPTRPGIITWFW